MKIYGITIRENILEKVESRLTVYAECGFTSSIVTQLLLEEQPQLVQTTAFHAADRFLQRLRREGKIRFSNRRWYLAPNQIEMEGLK